ncbi:MAG: peptidylprolyl isomerase [Candidatus Bipolaricaulota bacterium]|nr:peptidylprolyl isomerase [Candidatus Bipolaricaulota bacterium]MBS3791133.1 peptidylprolyl isomerase [Candidatus Bipolaricaulota bacterium]
MNFSKRNLVIFSLVLLLVTPTLGVLAQEDGAEQQSGQQGQPTVLATVNGSEITDQQLSQRTQVYQIIMTLSRQFRSFAQFLMTSEAGNTFLTEYRKYMLENLIEQELQLQKMDELGIEVNDEEIQEQIDNIIENNDQFEDEKSLEDYLKNNQNMSLDDLKASIRQNLRQQKLREEVTGQVEVTEEEITSFYEQNKQNYTDDEGNVKPLEEVRDQIEGTIRNQKGNEAWTNWLEEVKEEASIEKNLENL